MRTREPRLSFAPGCGLCATTMPAGSAEGTSNSLATKPALRALAPASSARAQSRLGTDRGPGPDETLTVTVAPGTTGLPGSGSVATTTPEFRSEATARKLSFRPRSRRRFSATGRGSPIRRGTTDGPEETISNTSRSASSRLPPPGSCRSTRPRGRALGRRVTTGLQARRRDSPARVALVELDDGWNAHLLRGGIRPRAGELGCADDDNEQQQEPGRSGAEVAHRADDRVAARCEG